MPVAPRYQPDGVRVGSMPTPQVRPQTGLAEGLASVGESLAGIGRTIDRAQEFKTAADDAMAQEAFTRYKRDRDADYDKFKTDANGVNIAKSYESFNSTLDGDVQAYVKDLSPEQQASFEKRRQFQNETYRKAADGYTHAKSVTFIAETSTQEMQSAVEDAAMASVSGDVERYTASMGRAIKASDTREKAVGMRTPSDDLIAASRYKALDILVKSSPEEAISYYEKYQTQMGQFSDNASKLVQVSADKVSVKRHMDVVLTGARDANGNLDASLAGQAMAKAEQAYASDPLLRMDDQRRQVIQEQFGQVMAADSAERKATGDAVLRNIDAIYTQPNGHLAAKQYIQGEGSMALKRMRPEERVALTKKLMAGPTVTDEAERAQLNSMIDSATQEQDFAAIESLALTRVLSVRDREELQNRLTAGKGYAGKAEGQVRSKVKSLWEEAYQRNVPSWKDAGSERQLTDGEHADIAAYKAHADEVWSRLSNVQKPTDADIQKLFKEVSAKVQLPDGSGGVIDKPYATTTVSERSDAKAAQKKEDRRNAAMDVMQKRREEAGLGPDPGEPSTVDYLFRSAQDVNWRIGLTP